ncbi:MAG: DUF4404 family protein [Cyanobacteria bacterium J06643_4]
MSKEDIAQSIQALHNEIDQLATADVTVKEKLLALINDLETQMENPDSAEKKTANLQQLPVLIEQFEADHPKVTASLGR